MGFLDPKPVTPAALDSHPRLSATALSATYIPQTKVTENVARAFGWAIITDPQWAGGAKTDGTNAQPAIAAALASSSKTVFIPNGDFTIEAAINPTAYSGKRITGSGSASTLKVGPGVSTAAILCTSAGVADLTLDNFKIDLQWTAGRTVLAGIQVTNGNRISIDSLHIYNSGGAGVNLQGLGTNGGTPDSRVTRCVIDGTGLADSTTGFGVNIKDNSDRCVVEGNRLRNIKGGMGIGMSGSAGTGYPNYCMITRNHGTMAPSTQGYEFIGITAGCNYNVISHNVTDMSYDNAYSISGSYNAVIGNVVYTCWNHGIGVSGSGNTITGNIIRNVGRQDALVYGGVSIDNGAFNTVANNFIFDDNADASPNRMSYMVKFVSSAGNNLVGPNTGFGYTVGQATPLNSGRVPSDALVEVSVGKFVYDALTINAPAGTVRPLRFSSAGVSRWAVLANATTEGGGNSGSNLEVKAYDDAGADIGTTLRIDRANRLVSSPSGGFVDRTKAGIPSDADFATTPPDGISVLDTTNHRIYYRSGGLWKYSALV